MTSKLGLLAACALIGATSSALAQAPAAPATEPPPAAAAPAAPAPAAPAPAAPAAPAPAATAPAAPAPAAPAPAAPAAPVKLTGLQAFMSLVGNTIKGKIDGEDAYEYIKSDGTTVLMVGTDIVKGTWAISGQAVCYQYPEEELLCYTVEVTGRNVTFTEKDGTGTRWQLMQGNPKQL
jgi:hypothetical protein